MLRRKFERVKRSLAKRKVMGGMQMSDAASNWKARWFYSKIPERHHRMPDGKMVTCK